MAQLKYRPEIDGLRTIAVMSVVLYHAGFLAFGGGYVGVDVFFVISGYLITSLIVREARETGGFQFGRFYIRRIRRLFPALFCTTLVSWALAFLFFSPAALQDFAASAVAGLTSLSNFYFWHEADYFDAAAVTKPLLHTWSLSVEEQFYLIWPAFVVFCLVKMRTSLALLTIAILSAASLMVAEHWIAVDRDAAFYLLPARLVELAIGAALVWVEFKKPTQNWQLEIGAFAGLGAILWAMFTYTHDTAFPGIASIWPCLGTALFILCSDAKIAGFALRLKPSVFIGKISYSLYLVHWPVIVFYTMVIEQQPSTAGKLLMVALSLMLGWMQYEFIENRFRHGSAEQNKPFLGWISAAAAPVAVLSALAFFGNGLAWRIPESRVVKSDFEQRAEVRSTYCRNMAPKDTFAGQNPELVSCQNYRGKKNDIYIWGDSHAQHLAPGFARAYSAYNVYILYMNGCNPQSGFGGYVRKVGEPLTSDCVARNKEALKKLADLPPTNILLTSAKRSKTRTIAKASLQILEPLKENGHRVSVVADFIRPGRSLIACQNVPSYVISDDDLKARCGGMTEASHRELRYNRSLAKLLPELVQVNDLQCAFETCKFYHRGAMLYRDSHHLNILGSEYFVRKLKARLNIQRNGPSKPLDVQESAQLKN